MRVVRRPARPCWSIEACQERNSSTVSVYRAHASSSDKRPPRTAATTSAFRRMTQRLVVVGGRSAIVSGLPSGPITYLTLGRWGSFIGTLTKRDSTDSYCGESYKPRLKICLSMANASGNVCPVSDNLLVTDWPRRPQALTAGNKVGDGYPGSLTVCDHVVGRTMRLILSSV